MARNSLTSLWIVLAAVWIGWGCLATFLLHSPLTGVISAVMTIICLVVARTVFVKMKT